MVEMKRNKTHAIRFRYYMVNYHDDVIKWKHFPRYWPFVIGIHRWPVDSPHKGQWRGALMDSLVCTWTNGWANNRDASDLRRHRAHDVTVMISKLGKCQGKCKHSAFLGSTKYVHSRDHYGHGLGQWEEALRSNAFSRWPSPYPKWSLHCHFARVMNPKLGWSTSQKHNIC